MSLIPLGLNAAEYFRSASVILASALSASPALAQRGCYGDCSGNGIALLLLAPIVFLYLMFWNERKGGPSIWQCIGYLLLSIGVSLCVGFAVLHLTSRLWLSWTFMAVTLLASFAFLIHPKRHARNR